MLIIQPHQMKVFQEAALRRFEDDMAAHVKKFVPRQAEVMGDEGVRLVVRQGIGQAKEIGLTWRGPVRFYIDMMFMLGCSFDTDPQYPWAREILTDRKLGGQIERSDRLHLTMQDYIARISGKGATFEKNAMVKVSRSRYEQIPSSGNSFVPDVLRTFNDMHPEKCGYVGKEALTLLIQEAGEAGKGFGVTLLQGIALIAGLMFALGHGCLSDAQYPWIADILRDPSVDQPDERIRKLHTKMTTYFGHALEELEKG